jgi:hypothetical protein
LVGRGGDSSVGEFMGEFIVTYVPFQMILIIVMRSLNPTKVYPGHVARGIILDGHTDLDYSLRYLRFFHKHVLAHDGELPPQQIYDTLLKEFPDASGNLDFLLNRTAENFGTLQKNDGANGRQKWTKMA